MKTTLVRLLQSTFLIVVFYLCMVALTSLFYKDNRRLICYFLPYIQRVGGQEPLMLSDYNAQKKYDIVVLGSSHAYRGYDPRIFANENIQLFNAGSSSQNTLVSRALATHILQPSDGQLYIIDIYDKVWSGDGIESCNRFIQNSPSAALNTDLTLHALDLRKINQYSTWLFSDLTQFEVEAKDYVADGYCSKNDSLQSPPQALEGPEEINPLFQVHLDRLLQLLEEKSVEYIFVSHPHPTTEGLEAYHKPMKTYIDSLAAAKNTFYFDYTSHPSFSDFGYFADANHLNQKGVDLFNELLIRDLKEKLPSLMEGFQTSR
jgi:hypothetical protein